MRVFAVSDIHIDFADNMGWVRGLSDSDYVEDTLLLAGDVSHDLAELGSALSALRRKFRHLFFVPGNHDLWLLRTPCRDSLEKLEQLLERCGDLGVRTRPGQVRAGSGDVRIVPLFSWYTTPEEGDDSLFLDKKGEDPSLEAWSDTHFVKWPKWPDTTASEAMTPAAYFLRRNEPSLEVPGGNRDPTPVLSFSHFLPRSDLMLDTEEEKAAAGGPIDDPNPSFNFSRVAGSRGLEEQVRRLGSAVHVYGHQHRNRDRTVDGIRYVSYCLGYRRERDAALVRGLGSGPLKIWE